MGQGGDTVKGAAAGAAMGAPLGPVGAGVGGVLGGLYGYFSSPKPGDTPTLQKAPATADYQRQYLKDMLGRGAPMMNAGQSDQARGQQQQLAQMLFQQASGQRQGAGELAVQRQAGNAMANNTSAAQMSRGANAAMAGRNAMRANSELGVNAAGQAGIAQLQDQQSAQNQLGGLLGATRGQDIQTAGANQQAQMGQQQIQLQGLSQMLGVDQAELGQSNAQAAAQQAEAQRRAQEMAALMQAGGQIYGGYLSSRPPQKPAA